MIALNNLSKSLLLACSQPGLLNQQLAIAVAVGLQQQVNSASFTCFTESFAGRRGIGSSRCPHQKVCISPSTPSQQQQQHHHQQQHQHQLRPLWQQQSTRCSEHGQLSYPAAAAINGSAARYSLKSQAAAAACGLVPWVRLMHSNIAADGQQQQEQQQQDHDSDDTKTAAAASSSSTASDDNTGQQRHQQQHWQQQQQQEAQDNGPHAATTRLGNSIARLTGSSSSSSSSSALDTDSSSSNHSSSSSPPVGQQQQRMPPQSHSSLSSPSLSSLSPSHLGPLAAATERLESSPPLVTSPLKALQDSGLGQHSTHLLPDYKADQQQQEMLAKATAVIERLRARGYSAFIVGGWVRDVYLQRRPADIDIATSASPLRVRHIFVGDHMVDLPRSTVKLTHQGEAFELSFFKGVSRTSSLFSVGMDAVYRDFTVNALYYDPATNQVLDFVGGVEDALSRTLRLCHDDTRRLTEDPLRVLRGVRFATVLGLKLSPGTAGAMRQHAHMCSLNAGVPARRIWLELNKLCKAEVQQPGAWLHALRLSYHLGLLPHLFPWLQPQQQQPQQQHQATNSSNNSSSNVPDPFGHGVSTRGDSSSSSSGGGSGGSTSTSSSSKAVLVAERLSKLRLEQQQQQQKKKRRHKSVAAGESPAAAAVAVASSDIPLPLLVAATVHPSPDSYAQAAPYLRQLFPDAGDWECIETLMTAAQLAKGSTAPAVVGGGLTAAATTAAGGGSPDSAAAAAADSSTGVSSWSRVYSHPQGAACLRVLSCWMPDALATSFLRYHVRCMAAAAAAGSSSSSRLKHHQPSGPQSTASLKQSGADLTAALAALGGGGDTRSS